MFSLGIITEVLPMGDWKPRIPPYDFVKLMEEDNTYQKQRQDRVGHQLANEEEIIFDTGILIYYA